MKSIKPNLLKGIMMGVLCGVIYGIYPALINIVPYFPKEHNTISVVAFTMATVALLFFFCILVNIITIGPKKYFGVFVKFCKNKDAWKVSAVNLLGAPIGMGFMAVGISLAGGALGKTFVALCIPATALLERFVIKKKFGRLAIFGILLTTASAVVLGIYAINPRKFQLEILIGILFCMVTAFAWATQGVLMYKIVHHSDLEITTMEITVLKFSSAFVFQVLIVLPLMTLISFSPEATYVSIGKLLSDYDKSLPLVIVGGFVIFISYISYFSIVKALGATSSIVFENLSIIFTPIFIIIFFAITKAIDPNDASLTNPSILHDMDHIKTWWFWTFATTLLLGVFLTVFKPNDRFKNFFKRNKKNVVEEEDYII